jgi:hypothetical protein
MNKVAFKLYIEIINNLLDSILAGVLNLKTTKWYKEYAKSKKPRVKDLILIKLSLYSQDLIIFLKKSILYILDLLPPHLSLMIISLLIKIKRGAKITGLNE